MFSVRPESRFFSRLRSRLSCTSFRLLFYTSAICLVLDPFTPCPRVHYARISLSSYPILPTPRIFVSLIPHIPAPFSRGLLALVVPFLCLSRLVSVFCFFPRPTYSILARPPEPFTHVVCFVSIALLSDVSSVSRFAGVSLLLSESGPVTYRTGWLDWFCLVVTLALVRMN